MNKPKGFLFNLQDGIGTITLNRPESLNSLTFEIYAELRDFFADLAHEQDVRTVVITGAGRGFCSGGSFHDIIAELLQRDMAKLLEFTRMTGALIRNILSLEKPVVASVNGACVGAGAVIALASDMRIASAAAKFGFVFVKVGLSGADMGAAWLLPRLVGLGKASELLMTGDVINAREAERIGLVNRVVEPDALGSTTTAMARKLADGPTVALAMTKRMLHNELNMDLSTAIEAEARVQAILMKTPEFKIAHDAFVNKQEPNFHAP